MEKTTKTLALFACLCMFAISGFAQKAKTFNNDHPKLVVGVIVDQMRYEYIPRFWDKFGEGGFKRLVNDGYNFSNNHFNYVPTKTGPGHAAIFTGATPSVNGIIGNDWYERDQGQTTYVVLDSTVQTLGASGEVGHRSPAHLMSTTITDELKAFHPDAKVVGVSIKDRSAILPAGHAGDGAFWYDEKSGNFVSSTWYMEELPDWANSFNAQNLSKTLSNKTWETLLPIDQYTESNQDNTPYEGAFDGEETPTFPHKMDGSLDRIQDSPFGNTLVRKMAEAALAGENMGSDDTPDFLSMSFSSTDYVGHQFGPRSIEVEDTYLRLDKELESFLSFLDQKVGKGNYILFLTADHGAVDVPQSLKDRGLPGGYFDEENMVEELKNFLNNKYGAGDWVEHYMLQQVYLNHDLINAKDKSLEKMQLEVAEYLQSYSSIVSTYLATDLEREDYTEGARSLYQNGFYADRSGDVFIQLKPGWLPSYRVGTTHGSPYSYDTHVPLLFYGKGVPQGHTIKKSVIPQIAPTVSTLLDITFPSGSADNPLIFE